MASQPAKLFSSELEGVEARLIEVEVDLNVGLHAFTIVGLGDKAVGEARERVNSALKNCGVKPPNRENRRITVNLAPADIKKGGSQYDLAIALGYLAATGQIQNFESRDKLFVGELALDGRLRPIAGALAIAELASSRGFEYLFLPAANANEASVVQGVKVIALEDLAEAIDLLEEKKSVSPRIFSPPPRRGFTAPDFSEIKGQNHAKRALLIAASGGHNLLMIGPPGVGKSLLAEALGGILPNLSLEESVSLTKIWSAAGLHPDGLVTTRPFRAPHQSASAVAITGGGTDPRPGEISLAHHGILFLDELPEFPRGILESLRAPLENGVVRVARAKGTLSFPARFTLVAAMNPCPCGYYGDSEKECRCSAYEIIRYQKKISGPLLDRVDLQVRVPRVPLEELRKQASNNESAAIKERVETTRQLQAERLRKHESKAIVNSEMSAKEIEAIIKLDRAAEEFLKTISSIRLSPRGFYRLLKTARTIADLEASEGTRAEHVAEALSYRLREEA